MKALSSSDTDVMTTIQENKTLVSDFIDALFSKGDLGAVDDHLAEDFVNHDPPLGTSPDREVRLARELARSGRVARSGDTRRQGVQRALPRGDGPPRAR